MGWRRTEIARGLDPGSGPGGGPGRRGYGGAAGGCRIAAGTVGRTVSGRQGPGEYRGAGRRGGRNRDRTEKAHRRDPGLQFAERGASAGREPGGGVMASTV